MTSSRNYIRGDELAGTDELAARLADVAHVELVDCGILSARHDVSVGDGDIVVAV